MDIRSLYRPFGSTGLILPPVVFAASPLTNRARPIPDQAKLQLVGEWLSHVPPPLVVEVTVNGGTSESLPILARAIRRFEINPIELVLAIRCPAHASSEDFQKRQDEWGRTLGSAFAAQIVSLDCSQNNSDAQNIIKKIDSLRELKEAGSVRAIGICSGNPALVESVRSKTQLDWVTLRGCLTILKHPPEALVLADTLEKQGTPIVSSSILHSGFLAGGNELDGRPLDPHNETDQKLFAWRKSFAALCHGHGTTPIHAAIQFALLMPAVHAVRVNTSYPDRVRENIAAITDPVSPNLWKSMTEEGLLALDSERLELSAD
jgi:D-threo-aldose 1-dehydrogenase